MIQDWYGHPIEFVKNNDIWYAKLDDFSKAFGIPTNTLNINLDDDELDVIVNNKTGENTLYISENGIYDILLHEDLIEAKNFKKWTTGILVKLRKLVGLDGNDMLRMLEPDIQNQVDNILDTIYWDEENKCVMRSVTVAGGDVEQVRL